MGSDDAGGAQGVEETFAGGRGECGEEGLRCAQERVGEKGGIHQRLGAVGEVETVGRVGIDGSGERGAGELAEFRLRGGFGGVGDIVQLKPRGETGEGAADGFKVGDAGPGFGVAGGGFDGHGGVQATVGEGCEGRESDALEEIGPVTPGFGRRWGEERGTHGGSAG